MYVNMTMYLLLAFRDFAFIKHYFFHKTALLTNLNVAFSKIKIYELFSGFSEVKMSLKIDVSTSSTGLLQVVKNPFELLSNLEER